MTVRTVSLPQKEADQIEILRYMGCRSDESEISALVRSLLPEAMQAVSARVCYGEFDVRVDGDNVDFGFARVCSQALAQRLDGCTRAVIFAATVGIGMDRLIARYATLSPAKALCIQSIGTERVESLCDTFEEMITEGKKARGRFSAGYGDLPLEFQREIFRALDCPKRIGLSLNESLLMSPSKSVTAIIGIE